MRKSLGKTNIGEIGLRKALARDIPIIEEVFARAFDADPFLNWYVLPGKRRKERIIRSFDILIREIAMEHDQIFTTTDSIKGGAVWVPPGKWEMGILRQLSLMRLTPRITGLSRLFTRILGLLMIEDKHPKVDHYCLLTLGVDPPYQNRGIGSALLRYVIKDCDDKGIPAYLETALEKDVRFYKSHGFEIRGTLTMPAKGPMVWLMWRDPR
ncbi:MAG: hypothetical protein DRG37_05770 [Deltaproteobacteria bacterium]|nr:MAG: hypothetical protein DRG37_05770 [Deltaproteobacteria bacterium]